METSAVNWLWKVIQEHLKNPFDIDEWGRKHQMFTFV